MRRARLGFFALALLPRLLFWGLGAAHPDRLTKGDSEGYIALAANLLHRHAFATEAAPPLTPDTARTPAYPFFLIPFVAAGASGLLWAALAQCLLGAWAAAYAARRLEALWGRSAAWVGFAILAFDPVTLFHTPLILTETLFVSLVIAGLWAHWDAVEGGAAAAIRSGLLWALAALTRPIAFYLPILAVWLLRPRARVAFLVAAYLLPGVWLVRNRVTTGYATFSSIGAVGLLRYTAAGVESLRTGRPVSELDPELRAEVDRGHRGPWTNDAEQGAAYSRKAMEVIRPHPFLLAEYCAWGAVKVLGGTGFEMLTEWIGRSNEPPGAMEFRARASGQGTLSLIRRHPWLGPLVFLYIAGLLLSYTLASRGAWRLLGNGSPPRACWLVLGAAYFVGLASAEGYYRYRIPVLPFVAVAAAAGARSLRREKS